MLSSSQLKSIYPTLPDSWLFPRYDHLRSKPSHQQLSFFVLIGIEEWFNHIGLFDFQGLHTISRLVDQHLRPDALLRIMILDHCDIVLTFTDRTTLVLDLQDQVTHVAEPSLISEAETLIVLNVPKLWERIRESVTQLQGSHEDPKT